MCFFVVTRETGFGTGKTKRVSVSEDQDVLDIKLLHKLLVVVLAGPIRGEGGGMRSAGVEIVWSALKLVISSERGALSYSEMGSESGAATTK